VCVCLLNWAGADNGYKLNHESTLQVFVSRVSLQRAPHSESSSSALRRCKNWGKLIASQKHSKSTCAGRPESTHGRTLLLMSIKFYLHILRHSKEEPRMELKMEKKLQRTEEEPHSYDEKYKIIGIVTVFFFFLCCAFILFFIIFSDFLFHAKFYVENFIWERKEHFNVSFYSSLNLIINSFRECVFCVTFFMLPSFFHIIFSPNNLIFLEKALKNFFLASSVYHS
jgi:hypothetical protein